MMLLTREQLADAAFGLLTSNGIERYAKVARQAAARAHLEKKIRENGPEFLRELERRSYELVARLLTTSQRDEMEVELAVLLAAISATGTVEADRLLPMLAQTTEPSLTWITGLAKHLLMRRTVTVNEDCARNPGGDLRVRPCSRAFTPKGVSFGFDNSDKEAA